MFCWVFHFFLFELKRIKKVTNNLNNLTLSQRANPNKAYPINAFAIVGLRLAAWIYAPNTIPIPAPTPANAIKALPAPINFAACTIMSFFFFRNSQPHFCIRETGFEPVTFDSLCQHAPNCATLWFFWKVRITRFELVQKFSHSPWNYCVYLFAIFAFKNEKKERKTKKFLFSSKFWRKNHFDLTIFNVSNNTQHSNRQKEKSCCLLPQKNIRCFNRHRSKPCQQATITNQTLNNFLMKSLKCWTTYSRFVNIGQKTKSLKYQSYCTYSCKFIRNRSKNSINCLKVPFRNNMCWCRIRVCRNIIIRMTQSFRCKRHQSGCALSQNQCCTLIFRIVIGIEINQIGLGLNSQRICRSILMQCCKMNQTQSSLQKRKQIVKTIESIQGRIIYAKSTPEPPYNAGSNNRQRTCQTCNNSSSPQTHLTPGEYISNKSCLNHNLQNNNPNQPYKFTRLCITSIIQTSKQMHVNNNKKKRCTICMQISQQPTVRNITHQMLNAMKRQINVCSIMHCLKNTGLNLQYLTQTCLNPPIVISIQIRRSRITNLMILDHCQDRLIPQTSTQFLDLSSHFLKKSKKI